MLVILRENVENLGQVGDLVKVTDGYARNYLLPRKLVVAANEKNEAAIEFHRKSLEKKRQQLKAAAEEIVKKLGDLSVSISRKVGENDKLFGSVSTADIADALNALGQSIEKRQIQIDQPIKALGVHTVSVRLAPEITGTLKVWVVKEA
jgi:large subunit ribosomal protein L9